VYFDQSDNCLLIPVLGWKTGMKIPIFSREQE